MTWNNVTRAFAQNNNESLVPVAPLLLGAGFIVAGLVLK